MKLRDAPEHFWPAVERIEAELNRLPLFEPATEVLTSRELFP